MRSFTLYATHISGLKCCFKHQRGGIIIENR
jgi:hypothetical protein